MFKKDYIKAYSFGFVILASAFTGVLVTPPPLKPLLSRYVGLLSSGTFSELSPFSSTNRLLLQLPAIWIAESVALGWATLKIFQLYMHLEERWQSKLLNYPPPKNDPVAEYDNGHQHEYPKLRGLLWSALAFLLLGFALVLVRAALSNG